MVYRRIQVYAPVYFIMIFSVLYKILNDFIMLHSALLMQINLFYLIYQLLSIILDYE